MEHHRGMRIDRENKNHHRKCVNCSETELTPEHIFNCPVIIPNLLKIGVFPKTVDLSEDNIELIVKGVIDGHGHILLSTHDMQF